MAAAAALLLASYAIGPNHPAWVYSKTPNTPANAEDQAETWASYPTCLSGRAQSPINIITAAVAPAADALDGAIIPALETVPILPINTGHSFQLHETSPEHTAFVEYGSGLFEEPTGLSKGFTSLRDERYNFYQVHWHTPSENWVDGVQFPMEAHFVHQLNGSSAYNNLGVIAVLYELREECNDALDGFWDMFPLHEDASVASVPNVTVDLQKVLQSLLPGGYYHWSGSLTTPPCTEGVTWNLMKWTLPVCRRQVDRLADALGTNQHGVRVNNRVIQPLNQRVISQTGPPEDDDLTPYGISTYVLFAVLCSLLCGAAVCLARRRSPSSKQLAGYEAQVSLPELGMSGAATGSRKVQAEEGRDINGRI